MDDPDEPGHDDEGINLGCVTVISRLPALPFTGMTLLFWLPLCILPPLPRGTSMLERLATTLPFRFVARQSVIERQAGAIPYSLVDGQVAVLLVTSRRTGRWIFPKGGLMSGLTAHETAALEALEEAGVEGTIADVPLGSWRTIKRRGVRVTPIEVDMFPLLVTRQHEEWIEKEQRRRHWAGLREARQLLYDPYLADLAALLRDRV